MYSHLGFFVRLHNSEDTDITTKAVSKTLKSITTKGRTDNNTFLTPTSADRSAAAAARQLEKIIHICNHAVQRQLPTKR